MTLDQWIAVFGSEQAYLDAAMRACNRFLDLARWVVEHSADSPQGDDLAKIALIAATFNSPDCDPAWRRLAVYALNNLDPRSPDLTPEEERIRAIAADVFRIEKLVAREHNINLYPSDSEDAYQRALEELAPYLNKKETIQ